MFLGALFIGGALFMAVLSTYLPTVDLKHIDYIPLKQSVIVYDANNVRLAHAGTLQIKVPFSEIPTQVVSALLATEDMHFWSHFGLNPGALSAAVLENMTKKAIVRGGSTITQQLAKNILLDQDPTMSKQKTRRKIVEMWLALHLERSMTKERILEAYLNRVYFGRGAYGIKAAAKLYFDKDLSALTQEEAAYLVGLVRAPSMYATNFHKAIDRTAHVLRRLQKAGFTQRKYSKMELLKLVKPIQHRQEAYFSHFVTWVVSTIPQNIAESQEPILLYSTLDPNLQKRVAYAIPDIRKQSRFGFSQLAFIGCGLDGSVKAMIGGLDSINSGFNRAIQAFRPAGSTFKIYTYMCAFLQGMRSTDTVEDTPPTIGGWTPSNYMHNEVGFVTLERAFAESINGATVRIAMECGLNNIMNLARVFGLTGTLPNDFSSILGSASVTLYQLIQTMLILSNNGYQRVPYGIREIKSHGGTVLHTHLEDQAPVVIISDKEALKQMNKVMESVVNKGTGRFAKNAQYSIGGKTGTSQDYRDVWFIGQSPFLIAGAWCGHDDNSPMNKQTKAGLINPAVAICKEAIQIESEAYEEVPEVEEKPEKQVVAKLPESIQPAKENLTIDQKANEQEGEELEVDELDDLEDEETVD